MKRLILIHLLEWLKEKHLDKECTRENSDIVSCCDYLIERLK